MKTFFRSENKGYENYKESFLQAFEIENIKKAVELGLLEKEAIEIVERFIEEEGYINSMNFEEIYLKEYMDDSKFYLKNSKLAFATKEEAEIYGKEITGWGYKIVEYTCDEYYEFGTEPTEDFWEEEAKVYCIVNPIELN